MYGNQPLSKFGCEYQANYWGCGYYLPNQVLIKNYLLGLFFFCALLLTGLSHAEAVEAGLADTVPAVQKSKYYTWVDAQGIMHNTLITPEKTPQTKISPNTRASTSKTTKNVSAESEFDESEFSSEEEYQQDKKDELAAHAPFFTWTDAEGIIRSEAKPDVVVEFTAEEIVYDAVFAPPFRLPAYVMNGHCCESYADAFAAVAQFNGSASYHVDETIFPFQTQSGDVSAAYFTLPELAAKEIILLKAYKLPADAVFEVIALDEAFQPLYLASRLKGIFVEQTWKDLAYKKVMLEISDTDVKYLIAFVRSNTSLSAGKGLTDYRLSVMRDQLLD
jgi:hypothetical protein